MTKSWDYIPSYVSRKSFNLFINYHAMRPQLVKVLFVTHTILSFIVIIYSTMPNTCSGLLSRAFWVLMGFLFLIVINCTKSYQLRYWACFEANFISSGAILWLFINYISRQLYGLKLYVKHVLPCRHIDLSVHIWYIVELWVHTYIDTHIYI